MVVPVAGGVASVAAGIGPLALCTDGGGSIRRPAAHTGLYGLKPSLGMVPRAGGFPEILYHHEVAGTVARCIADLDLSMQVLAKNNWSGTPRTSVAHCAFFTPAASVMRLLTLRSQGVSMRRP